MMVTKNIFFYLFLLISFKSHGQEFFLGADLSYVNELEDCGTIYKDRDGIDTDPFQIFSNEGTNIVRLRLWHDPSWSNYGNLDDIKVSIGRARALGMDILLDFHYSDFWTDPGRQWRPAAWEQITDDVVLGDSLYNYTLKVLTELNNEGLLPEMIQVGNEINGNILLNRGERALDGESPGLYPVNWTRQNMLLNRGLDAIEEIELISGNQLKSVIHVANPLSASSWFQNAVDNGLTEFDIIGLSYYPQWHKLGVRELGVLIKSLKNSFSKEVMIVETGYPWTSSSADQANNVLNFNSRLFTYSNNLSIDTQRDFMIELSWIIKENGGMGLIYWEPAWLTSSCMTYWGTGSHYENAALFDFNGTLHSGADFYSYDYNVIPPGLLQQEVKFKVDMTGINTDNGVFVTGDFTGDAWQFMPMETSTSEIYEFTTTILGRTEGAYIFYNNDIWSDFYRETVPDNCALLWGTHREYWIRAEPAEFYFSWGRCDQIPNEILLGIEENQEVSVYPTIVKDQITLDNICPNVTVEVYNLSGVIQSIKLPEEKTINVSNLPPGIYLMKLNCKSRSYTMKFLKQ